MPPPIHTRARVHSLPPATTRHSLNDTNYFDKFKVHLAMLPSLFATMLLSHAIIMLYKRRVGSPHVHYTAFSSQMRMMKGMAVA